MIYLQAILASLNKLSTIAYEKINNLYGNNLALPHLQLLKQLINKCIHHKQLFGKHLNKLLTVPNRPYIRVNL